MLNELWKDALGAVFKCTVAGTPGTWKQMFPAAVTADPASGTIPTGYMILNVTQGTLKLQALRNRCEELADDVRALSTLVHALRTALVNSGVIKGSP